MPKVFLLLFLLSGLAWGQANTTVAAVPADAAAALNDMATRAGVIFAGHVVAVERRDEAGYVDVRFAVDEAVKGCRAAQPYVLREWAGLWGAGGPRYVAGERLLMLLTGRGPSGMSAPVDGFAGVIPIHAVAVQPLADAKGRAPAEDGSVAAKVTEMTTDLRWVRTMTARTTSQSDAVNVGRVAIDGGLAGTGWLGPVSAMKSASATGEPTVAAALGVLRGAGR